VCIFPVLVKRGPRFTAPAAKNLYGEIYHNPVDTTDFFKIKTQHTIKTNADQGEEVYPYTVSACDRAN
jgi:hypothetical protein